MVNPQLYLLVIYRVAQESSCRRPVEAKRGRYGLVELLEEIFRLIPKQARWIFLIQLVRLQNQSLKTSVVAVCSGLSFRLPLRKN